MNFYFFPRIDGLEARVTLANFPPADGVVPWPAAQTAFVIWTDGAAWHARPLARLEPGHSLTISERDLPAEMSATGGRFICISPASLPPTMDRLPALPRMDTVPSWRANVQLTGTSTSVGYLGEYPDEMLDIPAGTLLSLGPLHQTGPGVSNKLVFVNLRRTPARAQATMKFFGLRSQTILGEATVRSNAVSIIDLDAISSSPQDPLCIAARGITGIPLFLSHTADFRQMSLEHTHPPNTLLLFGARKEPMRDMKNWWLSRIFPT